jgi:hypothetical protein
LPQLAGTAAPARPPLDGDAAIAVMPPRAQAHSQRRLPLIAGSVAEA